MQEIMQQAVDQGSLNILELGPVLETEAKSGAGRYE